MPKPKVTYENGKKVVTMQKSKTAEKENSAVKSNAQKEFVAKKPSGKTTPKNSCIRKAIGQKNCGQNRRTK